MRVLFVFLDGVGIGPPSPHNPLTTRSWPALEHLAGSHPWAAPFPHVDTDTHVVKAIDACLGVEGLPQSGTGQATLFTGVNCAEHVGRHFGPYPHSSTHGILREKNLFRRVHALALPTDTASAEAASAPVSGREGASGHAAAFANAYPPRFFDWVEGRGRYTVTTMSAVESGLSLRRSGDLAAGDAVSADITAAGWPDPNASISPREEAEAARHLVHLHRRHRCTLFEYYLTDKAGHGRLDVPAEDIVGTVDRFLGGIVEAMDPSSECLVITSDHGNLEELNEKTHTRNPVPLIAWGVGASAFRGVTDLSGVTPAIEHLLRNSPGTPTDSA